MTTRRRALVLAQRRSRGSLAAVRALGAGGWHVGVGTPDGAGMVTTSRHVDHRHVVPRPRGDDDAFLSAVDAAVRHGRYDVVFGGADDWMAALAHHRDALDVAVAHPRREVVGALLDKQRLTDAAARQGLATPRTVGDVGAIDWDGPVVVKCRRHWFPGVGHAHRLEARVVPDRAAAARQVGALAEAGHEAVLQEVVHGRLHALIGLFDGARLRARVQQVADGVWPTPAGVSARAVTVPVDEVLAEQLEGLLAAIGWRGLVEAQFLRGPDGVLRLIDCNGRFFGSMALSLAAGADLVDAWGRSVLGDPVPALPDARPGVRYVWLAGDLRRAVAERRGGLVADLASSGRLALGGATMSVYDRDDLRPWAHVAGSWLRRRVGGGRARTSPAVPVPDRV